METPNEYIEQSHIQGTYTPESMGEYSRLMEYISGMERIIDLVNKRIVIKLLKQEQIHQQEVNSILSNLISIETYKDELFYIFNKAEVKLISSENSEYNRTLVSAHRIHALFSDAESMRTTLPNLIKNGDVCDSYFIGPKTSPVVKETLKFLRNNHNIVGLEIGIASVSIVRMGTHTVYKEKILLKDAKYKKIINDEMDNIVFGAEGDIAGHSKRAQAVITKLVSLGLTSKLTWVASGKYDQLLEKDVTHITPYINPAGTENESIINALEGKGSLQIWGIEKLKRRIEIYKSILVNLAGNIVLVNDFSPAINIAFSELQLKNKSKYRYSMSQTHETRVNPSRPITVFKIGKMEIGRLTYSINNSFLKPIDPQLKIYQFLNRLTNIILDGYLGIPAYLYKKSANIPTHFPSFRKEIEGRNPPLSFSFSTNGDSFNVGLLSEGQQNRSDIPFGITKPVIYHNQGSTYDRRAFSVVVKALSSIDNAYTLNATGSTIDQQDLLKEGIKIGTEIPSGSIIGYGNGYEDILDPRTKISINQGGWGTISQSIVAMSDRLTRGNLEILHAIRKGRSLETINDVIKDYGGVLRWISIPRTWEQENNARTIQELGAQCAIINPATLKHNQKSYIHLQKTVTDLLNKGITKSEMDFWTNTVLATVSKSSPAMHAALLIQEIALNKQFDKDILNNSRIPGEKRIREAIPSPVS